MKHRKAKKSGHQPKLRLVGKRDSEALGACFVDQGQVLLPLLELVQDAKASIDELMNGAARQLVEQLLVVSAEEVAGRKHPGQQRGEIRWHGSQRGRIALAERKLAIKRPRLRSRAGEVAIVLPAMAGTVGIKKSSISAAFIKASEQALQGLAERRLEELELLAIYLDGIVVEQMLLACAIDAHRREDVVALGLAQGASENAAVAKDLLSDLLHRGLNAQANYLFIVDGSKALRAALEEVFAERAVVQRCRTHKVRNVTERISDQTVKVQTKAVMHAAYKLPAKEGVQRLRQQAEWLKRDYPDAALSLLEGLEETFTVNRLNLTPALMRCLSSAATPRSPVPRTACCCL